VTEQVEPDIIYPPGKNIAVLRNGVTLPTGPRGLSPSEIVSQIKDVVMRPYLGDDPRKKGMSLLEAATVAAAEQAADGNLDALEKLWNRLLGKPLTTVVQASGTLREFLDSVAKNDPPEGVVDPLGD